MKNCPICQSAADKMDFQVFDDRYGYPGRFDLYQCQNCQHIFLGLNQPLNLEKLYTEFYPRKSMSISDYQLVPTHQNPFRVWLNGEKGAYALVTRQVRILDIGCGFGQSLGYHKGRGCEVHGIEADANVQKISEHLSLNIKNGQFKPGLFDKDYFDYVTMDQVLEHIIDPLENLRTIHEILKPGGKLICTIPNAHGWGRKRFQNMWIHWHAPYHLHFFSKASLKIAAKQSGLRLKKTFTHTSSEWQLYQKLHNIYGANPEQPSLFWDSARAKLTATPEQDLAVQKVRRWHRRKWNHLVTRFFDVLGLGDNLFVVFEKT